MPKKKVVHKVPVVIVGGSDALLHHMVDVFEALRAIISLIILLVDTAAQHGAQDLSILQMGASVMLMYVCLSYLT